LKISSSCQPLRRCCRVHASCPDVRCLRNSFCPSCLGCFLSCFCMGIFPSSFLLP
jgi:hypothetical protein